MARFDMVETPMGNPGEGIAPGARIFALYGNKNYCIARVDSAHGDQVKFTIETEIDPDMNMYPGNGRKGGALLGYCRTVT
jgi:hypothetical protein